MWCGHWSVVRADGQPTHGRPGYSDSAEPHNPARGAIQRPWKIEGSSIYSQHWYVYRGVLWGLDGLCMCCISVSLSSCQFHMSCSSCCGRQARSQDFAQGGGAAPQKGPLPSVQMAPSDSPKGPFSLTRGPSDLHRGPLNVHGALWSFREGPGGPKDL